MLNKQGYFCTGYRTYKIHYVKDKTVYELIAWIQRRCILCGRFLNNKQKHYCDKCCHLIRVRWTQNYDKLRNYIYHHSYELKIGDYV